MIVNQDPLAVTATVRRKNQVTIPDAVMRSLGLSEGDRLRIRVNPDQRTLTIEPLPRSYAGVAPGLYGTEEEVAAYLDRERAAWDEE
jgi:AbrB family looped-hinge helix DNA binding protein